MRLQECSNEEKTILIAALSLLSQLPGDPARYTAAMGEIRETFFRTKGRGRGTRPRGFSQSRTVRAHPTFGSDVR